VLRRAGPLGALVAAVVAALALLVWSSPTGLLAAGTPDAALALLELEDADPGARDALLAQPLLGLVDPVLHPGAPGAQGLAAPPVAPPSPLARWARTARGAQAPPVA
jgi:hypothetical protein